MIKVCHVTSAHPQEDVRIFHKECVSLAKAGYDVYLVQQGTSYEKDGVHLVGFGSIAENRIKRMLRTTKAAYRAAREVDADVYHLHDPELLPYGLKLSRLGKTVIFDSHEHTAEAILEKEWLPFWIRGLIYRLYGKYQARICGKIAGVISVTPNIVAYFEKISRRVCLVANYPIIDQQNMPEPAVGSRIVFAGGISRQWNHHVILQALEKLPQCRYCLCGIVDSGYLESLKALPGWNQVDYLGKIPHKQVAQELAQSGIGVALLTPGQNTDWERGTIGNTKIFEQMQAGLPVICTDFILWREFVERYHCGICVDPTDPEQIVSAVRYLQEHPEEADQMGRNGQRAIMEEFNWGVEEKKLLALYEDILKN